MQRPGDSEPRSGSSSRSSGSSSSTTCSSSSLCGSSAPPSMACSSSSLPTPTASLRGSSAPPVGGARDPVACGGPRDGDGVHLPGELPIAFLPLSFTRAGMTATVAGVRPPVHYTAESKCLLSLLVARRCGASDQLWKTDPLDVFLSQGHSSISTAHQGQTIFNSFAASPQID